MAKKERYRLDWEENDSLGSFVASWMSYLEWSTKKTSEETGLDVKTINKVIKNKIKLNEEIAIGLSKMAMNKSFWYKIENYYKRKQNENANR